MVTTTSKASGIYLEGVEKRYDGGSAVLENLTLHAPAGSRLAVVGPSGCGKTTLLRILAGLEAPTAGTLALDGCAPALAAAHHLLGVAFQRPALVPTRTALENVKLTLEITGDSAVFDPEKMLTEFGLGASLHRFPHQLSGGMQQRVNIAAALVHDPRFLLLDEPFGALDELTRHTMIAWLGRVLARSQATVVLVTHSIEEAIVLTDSVVVMSPHGGRIVRIVRPHLPHPRPPVDAPEVIAAIGEVRSALGEAMQEVVL